MSALTMREEFEAWECDANSGPLTDPVWLMRDPHSPENYGIVQVQHNWEVWQASRATLSVDLTVLSSKIRFADDEVCTGLVRYDEACAAIEAAGVNCK